MSEWKRPRERIIRRAIVRPERIVVGRPRRFRPQIRAPLFLPLGFVALILVGTLLLSLPAANGSGDFTPFMIALFTATSAVCVTGLVVVDTGTYWSPFGQAVILLLIQVGGLGFATASTFLLMLFGRRVGLTERIVLGTSQGVTSVGGVLRLTRQIVVVTVLIETVGAVLLVLRFSRQMAIDAALWMGLFHSVSAFNNAGFDIIGDFRSLIPFNEDPTIVLTISVLVILGGISYIVLLSIASQRAYGALPFNTKLVLSITIILLVGGTAGLLLMEFGNPYTIGSMSLPAQVMNAFFTAVTPRTAGFTTLDVGRLNENSLLLIVALMYIGGAAGSTAGGIKVNTFGVIVAAVWSSIKGRSSVVAFKREIPVAEVSRAMSIALLFLGWIFLLTLVLALTEPFPLFQLLFEATSALATVGLSTGITPSLSPVGQLVIIVAMYVGRLGPLAVALALAQRNRPETYRFPSAEIKIG